MRFLTCAAVFVVCTSVCLSQIPNAGFENWTTDVDGNNNPDGWLTLNNSPSVCVEPATPSHGGSLAMKVKTLDLTVTTIPGIAFVETAYAFSETPKKFGAWVKSTIMTGDTAIIIIVLMKGETPVATTDSCTFKIGTSYGSFTYLEFPIGVVSGEIPDSLYIMVASGLGSSQVGTEIIVDDMAFIFDPATSIAAEPALPLSFSLGQNFPNPFNPSTKISFDIPESGMTTLAVYDLLGRQVAVLASGFLPAGTHARVFNAEHLPSGVYVYLLRSGSFQATKRLMVVK